MKSNGRPRTWDKVRAFLVTIGILLAVLTLGALFISDPVTFIAAAMLLIVIGFVALGCYWVYDQLVNYFSDR